MTKIFLTLGILLFISYPCTSQEIFHKALDCFAVISIKAATKDESIIFAHNEDTDSNNVKYFKVPRREHAPNDIIQLSNAGKIPADLQTEYTTKKYVQHIRK